MGLKHLAVIPDGNRRWAKKRGLSLEQGYEAGVKKLGELLKWCRDEDVRILSLWGFSTENFSRDASEVKSLFRIFNQKLVEALNHDDYHKHHVRIRFFGRRDSFPHEIRKGIEELERATAPYKDFQLNVFLGYGGRQEIVDAVNSLLKEGKRQIGEREFAERLYTKGVPDPDLIIRTSGEQRLSGLMPWQSAYSELYFSKKLWPDFTRSDFNSALRDYAARKRRFGK